MNDNIAYRFSASNFALWELHLYLDTHPCDKKAKELFKEYAIKTEQLKAEYERMYGPLVASTTCGEKWTKEPWPWQNNVCGGDN